MIGKTNIVWKSVSFNRPALYFEFLNLWTHVGNLNLLVNTQSFELWNLNTCQLKVSFASIVLSTLFKVTWDSTVATSHFKNCLELNEMSSFYVKFKFFFNLEPGPSISKSSSCCSATFVAFLMAFSMVVFGTSSDRALAITFRRAAEKCLNKLLYIREKKIMDPDQNKSKNSTFW
jgi:hypothetical protein